MANTIVEFTAPSGLTLKLKLFALGSDTMVNDGGVGDGDTCTEATNREQLYTATVSDALTGIHHAHAFSGTNCMMSGYIRLADDTNTYRVGSYETVLALPNAAFDAAGGLPISDAGGLDMDAILADTNELQGNQANWATATGFATETKQDIIDGIVDDIVADTNELQTDWANGGRLDLLIDELTTQGDTNEGKIDTIDTNVDAILVDTETTIPDQITALNNVSTAEVNAQCDLAISDALNSIADAVLKRDWTAVSGESARSALNALRFLRNKWSISGTTLTVTEEDDSTAAWTSTLTTDASAEPITTSDPA